MASQIVFFGSDCLVAFFILEKLQNLAEGEVLVGGLVGEVALLFDGVVGFGLVLLECLGRLEVGDIEIVLHILLVFESMGIKSGGTS